ncbi:MAG: response regulator [Myxococcales bacterium]
MIALVDDMRTLRLLLKAHLADLGAAFLEASNGQEALELIVRHRPRLVLSDVAMPVMDGIELVREIRSRPELSRTEVVVLSADAGEIARARAAAGDARLQALSKPIDPVAIRRVAREALGLP